MGASVLRGAELDVSASGLAWFVGAAAAARRRPCTAWPRRWPTGSPRVEEFIGVRCRRSPSCRSSSPARCSRSTRLPAGLTAFAKVLPLTHALALMRYGLLGGSASGLHDIWGMGNPTAMAALSLAVVAAFAAVMTVVAVRTFRRSAVQ